MTNVIKFPKTNKRIQELPTLEQIASEKTYTPTDEAIEASTELLASVMLEHMLALGFIPRADTGKEICFAVEAIKAMMHKYYGRSHPFHPLAEISFEPHESGGMLFVEPKEISSTKRRKVKKTKQKKTANTESATT